MNITKTVEGNTTTLALDGWLDTTTAPQLGDELAELGPDCNDLVIDLKDLEYISSAGLRQIVFAHKLMKGALSITNTTPEVMQVFKMAGFDRRLSIS